MCIKTINKNRTEMGLRAITGAKNIEELELLMPNATCLATYKQWQEAGRQVRKGEKSFPLRGARIVKDKKTGNDETKYYKFAVFDISQTDEIIENEN